MFSSVNEITGWAKGCWSAFIADAGSSGRPGAVVPREALEIAGVGAEVGAGGRVETEEKW